MSTIHAYWSYKKDQVASTLNKMLAASEYWQPDKLSRWCAQNLFVGLAKAQLYNTVSSKPDEVIHEKSEGLTITANARIDNRDALLEQLARGDDAEAIGPYTDEAFTTDSQLILRCYARWGSQCVTRLRGDFAFVIWDEVKQKLFCARDHFGIKVLFYSHNTSGVMVSNEHNAFFTSGWADKYDVDEKWMVENAWGLCCKGFSSPNPDISVLAPAHTLELDHSGLSVTRYWQLEEKTDWDTLSDEALISELKARFSRAVKVRLDSDYPIGAELSEGLDSNGIVGVAAKYLKEKPLFTFSYLCTQLSEISAPVWADTYVDIHAMHKMHKHVQAVWREEESGCNEEQPESKSALIRKHRPQFYRCFGGVIPTRSNNFLRSSLAQSKGIRVLLSGLGGDHCVTSYGDNYVDELFSQRKWHQLYQLYKKQYQRGRAGHPLKSMLALALKQSMPTFFLALKKLRAGVFGGPIDRARHHFLSVALRKKFNLDARHDEQYRKLQCSSIKEKERMELFDLGLNRRVVESEIMGRMARVEYRFPMLDVDLVEFAHSLPGHLKINQGIERYAFRQVLEGVTTKRIQWRIKADVAHPKLQVPRELQGYYQYLRERVFVSRLLKRFSSEQDLKKSLQRYDKVLFECLEFLCDVEEYYFTEAKLKKTRVDANELHSYMHIMP